MWSPLYCVLSVLIVKTNCESFPWLVKLMPSSNQTGPFKGDVYFIFEISNQPVSIEGITFEANLIPGRLFKKHLTLSTEKVDHFKASVLVVNSSCEENETKKFHMNFISFYSGEGGIQFETKTEQLINACANVTNFENSFIPLKNLIQTNVSDCFTDDTFYENGSKFNFGCRQNCTCVSGNVTCVSNCVATDSQGAFCRRVNLLGTCCPGTECEDDGSKKAVRCQPPELPIDFDQIPPWFYYIMIDRGFDDNTSWCGATLISDRWLLTAASCVIRKNEKFPVLPKSIEVFEPYSSKLQLVGQFPRSKISKVILHPEFDPNDEYSSTNFALLELSASKSQNEYRQHINMPRLKRCADYFIAGVCKLSLTTYGNDTDFLQFSHKLVIPSTKKILGCVPTENIYCYKSTMPIISYADGTGVFAKTNEHFDIVGIAVGGTTNWPSFFLKTSQFVKVLSICGASDWISRTI